MGTETLMRGQILLQVKETGVQGLIAPVIVLVRGSVRVPGVNLATQGPETHRAYGVPIPNSIQRRSAC